MPHLLTGQMATQNDTITIREVIIKHISGDELLPGYKSNSVDSVFLHQYSIRNIADVLTDNSLVLIKSYGPGGITIPTFRGTGAGHTQISWNNISINNPMTGQFDLSMVPAGFIDKVDLYFGGGSTGLCNGGIGGIINLSTTPSWKNKWSLSINPAAGSFGRFSGLVKLITGNGKIESGSRVLIQNSLNNFPYLNSFSGDGPVKEIRKNNQVEQNGLIEEIYFKMPDGILSAKFWYQSAIRILPGPIIAVQEKQAEKQKDESFRGLIDYSREKGTKHFNLKAALLSDNLHYTNTLASIDSRNSARTLILKSGYSFGIDEKTLIRADLGEELNVIKTNNYNETKSRNTVSLAGEVQTHFSSRTFARLLIKEIVFGNSLLFPDLSLAAQVKIIPDKEYYLSANFSKNSRIPSLNDMYWEPGGNPDLKAETGFTSEISVTVTDELSSVVNIRSELSLFCTRINNMIHWQPGEFAFWEAINIGSIRTSGLESSLRLKFNTSVIRIVANAGYVYTRASRVNEGLQGQQLEYIPRNRINGIIRLDWNHFYASIASNFSGRRFLNADNTQFLPAYCVSDLNLGTVIILRNTTFDISLDMTNIFNANYQSIAWYPMPGRAFMLSVFLQLNHKK